MVRLIMVKAVPYIDLKGQNDPIKNELMAALEEVLDRGVFTLGPDVEVFEQEFAQYTGSKHAVALNNGTSALHIALLVLGIGPGDEVITTPFTFAASAWAVSYVGATPVFVDIDPDTYNLDPKLVKDAITENTKAIIPVHLYGHPCDMDPLIDICDKHEIFLVEDAAQAQGSKYKCQHVGTFGEIGTFSFYPTKNLGACGEAGAIITDDDDLAAHAKRLRNHGSTKRYYHEEVGYNYRMCAMQGAILRIKLKYLDKWNLQRQKIAMDYNLMLANLPNLKLLSEAIWAESTYHLYSVATPDRAELSEYLKANEIGFSMHYPLPLHLQPCYKYLKIKEGSLPVAEKAAQEILNLPFFVGMTKGQIERVGEVVQNFFGVRV